MLLSNCVKSIQVLFLTQTSIQRPNTSGEQKHTGKWFERKIKGRIRQTHCSKALGQIKSLKSSFIVQFRTTRSEIHKH